MKKSLLKITMLLLLSTFLSAESLRDGVCIVRSNLSEKTTSFLTNYRDSLKSQGYNKYASSIDSYLKGTFGSGFIYDASNGKKFIITNRHVVSSADSVTVQFEKEDGTYDEYTSLKILAFDDDLDVALIEFPSTLRKSAIPVKTTAVNDGDDVWTAGFPGLAGSPAWQFGKGSVTNAFARIEELVSPEITTIIQHSAQIDGGNSGGPLLVKDTKSAYGYTVVGINTWKALNRENTNFSIPMKAVKSFVDKYVTKTNTNTTIEGRLEKFNKSIANKDETFERMSGFISNDMISSLSSNTFLKIIDKAPKNSQERIIENFVMNPLEGIRCALILHIWTSFRKNGDLLPYETSAPESEANFYNVNFVINNKQIKSKWIEEQGIWKIADFNGLVSENGASVGNSGFSISNPYTMEVYGSTDYILNPNANLDFKVGLNFIMDYYISYGVDYASTTLGLYQYNVIEPNVKLMIPLNFGNFSIIPYGTASYGVYFLKGGSEFDFSFGYSLGGGLEFAYDLGSCAPYIGANYCYRSYKPDPFETLSLKKSGLELSVGLQFGKTSLFKLW